MMTEKIGFLGLGQMATAIARGLSRSGQVQPAQLLGSTRTSARAEHFQQNEPLLKMTTDNAALVAASDLILLAVKPQQAPEALAPLAAVSAGKLFLSIMAGVTTTQLVSWLGPTARVVRAMPNTPVLIGHGMSAYAPGAGATPADLQLVRSVLTSVGRAVEVNEAQMDAVTALSGSGPAYVYHFIDELMRGGMEQGLSAELARELAVQTVLGSAHMVAGSGAAPLELAAKVKSPGGTTRAACAILEERNWGEILRAAIAAARRRATELSRENSFLARP